MNIEIKKSQKPVKYEDALKFMEKRLLEIDQNKSNDLIWILEHDHIYTAGKNFKENEIIDKSIKVLNTIEVENHISWTRTINLLFCNRSKKVKRI